MFGNSTQNKLQQAVQLLEQLVQISIEARVDRHQMLHATTKQAEKFLADKPDYEKRRSENQDRLETIRNEQQE